MSDAAETNRVIAEVLGPLIQRDGGQLYVLQATRELVVLHLAGRFSGCPGLTLTKRRVIEPAIFAVAPGARVVVTSGPLVPPGAKPVGGRPATLKTAPAPKPGSSPAPAR